MNPLFDSHFGEKLEDLLYSSPWNPPSPDTRSVLYIANDASQVFQTYWYTPKFTARPLGANVQILTNTVPRALVESEYDTVEVFPLEHAENLQQQLAMQHMEFQHRIGQLQSSHTRNMAEYNQVSTEKMHRNICIIHVPTLNYFERSNAMEVILLQEILRQGRAVGMYIVVITPEMPRGFSSVIMSMFDLIDGS